MKKKIKILLILLSFLLLCDYIPVKFALILDEKDLQFNEYLCNYAQVTGGNWEVENKKDITTNNFLYIESLYGKNPFDVLDENFDTDYLEPSGNRYLFQGELICKEDDIYDLSVEQWNIVYPIQRKSIRMLYAPKKYLTIYDFSWSKILNRWIGIEKQHKGTQ